jgi:hypothetical protein
MQWRLAVATALLAAGAGPLVSQSVRGVVRERTDGRSIGEAEVALVTAADTVVATVRSDAAGEFVVHAPGVGAYVIRVRRIGYAGGSTPVLQLATPNEYEIVIRIDRLTAPSAVNIVADPKRPWLSGFAERRASWFGSFLTAQEIQKMKLTATADVLRGLTGVVIRPNAMGRPSAWSSYGSKDGTKGPCELAVFTDGVEDDDGLTLVSVRPNDIEAIEVYAGAPKLPEAYRQNEKAVHCGAVLFWIRAGAHNSRKSIP